ncbi:MAG: hypothetical protein IKY83_00695 [Proteobacteria bacterium]|nr:hypothetical protein [Pseudomonadota bacterium]
MKHLLSILCLVFFLLPLSAFADPVQVNLVAPDKWESVTPEQNDSRIAVFVENATENRIEVMQKELAKESFANTFFEAIDEELRQNSFKVEQPFKKKEIQLSNGKKRTGMAASYKYDLTEVPINVQTFSFSEDSTTYIVICYFAQANKESAMKAFNDFLKKMTKIKQR